MAKASPAPSPAAADEQSEAPQMTLGEYTNTHATPLKWPKYMRRAFERQCGLQPLDVKPVPELEESFAAFIKAMGVKPEPQKPETEKEGQ